MLTGLSPARVKIVHILCDHTPGNASSLGRYRVPPAAERQEYSSKADPALPAAIYGGCNVLIAYFVVLRATIIAPPPPIQRVYTRGAGVSIARWFADSEDGCRLLPRRHNDQQRRPDRRAPPRGHRQARLPDTITR